MFKLIVEKELRDIIGSPRFAITFGICAILIIMTFFIGSQNYLASRAQYEAAKAENLRQMEGVTDWLSARDHRIFLPPQPVSTLVTGISNDIGRTIEMYGRGELEAQDSRFNNEPIFAIFRMLELNFVFQIVLSLFAILFAYNSVNGEKEHGTLRLTFANPIPRDTYILGKMTGSFLALAVPLLIPILAGCLLLPLHGIPMSQDDWLRLSLVVLTGMLYFGVFLALSVFVSTITHRSAHSFLILLVVWIFVILIIPRSSVLLAGRAVEVPSVDEIAAQKSRLMTQLWKEDKEKMSQFKPSSAGGDVHEMVEQFNKFNQKLADERDQKLRDLSLRLAEERRNRQTVQQRLAFSLARLSPAASFSLASVNLCGTSLDLKDHFHSEANAYQSTYAQFMKEKTGMALGRGVIMWRTTDDDEEPQPINPRELPEFQYREQSFAHGLKAAVPDIGLLALFNLIFFAAAFVGFTQYDVR